jgi:hypothetical protein
MSSAAWPLERLVGRSFSVLLPLISWLNWQRPLFSRHTASFFFRENKGSDLLIVFVIVLGTFGLRLGLAIDVSILY